jgi:MFS family permease
MDGWTRQQIIALAGCVLLISVIAYEQIAVSAAMPTVARHLGGLALYGVAFAVPLAATVLSMTVAGPWADAKGPVPVLWTGTGMFAAGLVLGGMASGMPTLIAGRTVQALGGGLDVVALYVLVARVFTARQVPKVFVGNSIAWVAPALFGPGISAFLVTHGLWRWVFFGAALVSVPAMVMLIPVLRGLPDSVPPDRRARLRLLPAIGASAGACLLSLSASRAVPVAVTLIALGSILVVVCAPRLMPKGTYTGGRGLPAVIMTRGLLGAAFSGTDVYLPLALTTGHGLTPGQAGWTLTVGGISWSASAWLAGQITADRMRRRAARMGLMGLAVGIAVCLIAALPGSPAYLMYIGWLVGGAGIGFGYAPLSVLLLGLSGAGEQGRNSSALQTNETLITAVVLAVTASLYGALHASAPGIAFIPVLAVPLAVAVFGWAWSFRLATAPETPGPGSTDDQLASSPGALAPSAVGHAPAGVGPAPTSIGPTPTGGTPG